MDNNDLLTLALLGDDAKVKESLKILLQAKVDAETASATARADQAAAAEERRLLKSERDGMETAAGAVGKFKAEFEAKEADLGRSNDALNEEKRKFEEVRAAVNADHTSREVAISAREKRLADREKDVTTRETHADAREKIIEGLHDSLSKKHERLKRAMAANRDDGDILIEPEQAAG